ncbi:uncharacterized protein LOC112595717 [Melanaphis sacchari]|uniref:uncharacterized protein LOC112595717 n=1 Tax=Melanaphis sacchari TaxID=742174 RepID=UPI000DC14124|nr:uncharacterized protein LOC112595717 [Melanaphis sacchari]XP_025196801.1 uncharacterized protein LOC112595717 [Melanaphis sacchari]
MDTGRSQQPDKKQLLQQQQLLLQKQLQQQLQQQQLLKHQQQQQQQLNLQQQQFKQQQQQLLQTQSNTQQQQQLLQTQPHYSQQQLSPNQQQLLIRNQDFLKQRGMQQGNLNQQQLLEHKKNQDQTVIDLIEIHDNNENEDKNQEDRLTVQRQQVIQQQQQSSLQRQQQLQQLQTQLAQQSQLSHQPHQQHPQFLQQSQQQFQNMQQLQNSQQLQSVQQSQLITQSQIAPKTQAERQPQVVRQPQAVQKSNSLQQPQVIQQQNNQYSPVSTQQQPKKQPPPHTQQLLQQQLQQLLLKNKSYPQRIVVLGNQQQQQQLSPQQSQRIVTNNSTGQQTQQMQCVVVTNTGQQPQQIQRVVVTGAGQQQQQQQIQRIVVGSNSQQQPQVQRVVVPTTVQHQQIQRVVVTSTGQQIQQQQLQHVVIPNTSQQQSHQVQNVSQTCIQQQVQRVINSTSGQQQQQLSQQNQPVPQRIVIGQLKPSQQTQQMQSSSQSGVVINQQMMQRQQQQRVVIAGQQQILKLTNQQQSPQQITLQKQLTHKLLQPSQQQQQQQQQQQDVVKTQLQQLDVVKKQNQQQDLVKKQQQQLDVVKNQHQQDLIKKQQQQLNVVKNQNQQLDLVKKQQHQQDEVKKQLQQQDLIKKQQQHQDVVIKQLPQIPSQQLLKSASVPLTQQQKNNLKLSNENLAKELHIKQSHQQLQQLHVQPSQKHSQEQINKQLQQQKLKQKKEIDQLQHQLKQTQRSGVIIGQLQQPAKPEPEKLKKQLEIQQQQRQKLQERLLLQQRQQQQKKLKDQQLQQKHQQQLREQVLMQQHLKQQQQQQLQQKLLLKQQASSENRLSLVVNGNQDSEKSINCYKKSPEPESLRCIEKVTATEKQFQNGVKRKNIENIPVSEKELLLLSSSDEDDDDETVHKQRNLLREAERLVQERYDALTVVLGAEYQAQYDEILRNWLASRLSREEFDHEIRKVMYVSWVVRMKKRDGDKNSKNASFKTNNTSSLKKTAKKGAVTNSSKVKEDITSLINTTGQKSPTLNKVAEENKELDINIESKEAKIILAERVPLHNALITSLIMWLPLNCQWLQQRKARVLGISETGSPLRLYTYADVPQVRGSSDHWYPDLPGSLARWYWPNHLSCNSSLIENNEKSFQEQERKEAADALDTAILLKPPSCVLLPLLMEVAENTEIVRRARQKQYQKRCPKKQNVKVIKRLQWQRLQEQKRLATMIRLRDGCSKLLRELKKRLRYLANQESRLIERLRRLQIRMSRRRRQVLAQFKIREQDLKSRVRKFFGKSRLEQPKIDSQELPYSDSSTNEENNTDDDEKDEVSQENILKQYRKKVHLSKKNYGGKKQLKISVADYQSKPNVQTKRPQPTALTIRLLRDRQQFLATTRLLQVTKQERLQISSNADYVREVRNKNCPCGQLDNRPCQYRRQIRRLRKQFRVHELAVIKKKIDRELIKKASEKEKVDSKGLQKKPSLEIEKKKAETQNKRGVKKSTNKTKPLVTKKNFNVEADQKKIITAKSKIIDNRSTKTNTTSNNSISNKTASLVTSNVINVEIKERQTSDNLDHVNKEKHNIGMNCEKFVTQTPIDSLRDTRNWIRPPLSKDKRSVVNVADAAARAAQAALAASKKTQLRKTRAAAAAAAAAATAATATISATVTSGTVDDDRRASELMPPPPPPPIISPTHPKTASTPRNPTIGARYLQQQKFLLDRHRQLERIRRDEEERRQRAQNEHQQQKQECSDKEEEETNVKTDDFSSQFASQRMRSKRQKVPVDTIRQDINQDSSNNEEQEKFDNSNFRKSKNEEERRQMNDYYFYYGGDDYYSSDEESSESSFTEPPFPPLLHDLRIDQLPRPMNRMPAAAVLPPGVRTRLQPFQTANSKNQDVQSSASYRKSQAENLHKRKLLETEHERNINVPNQKESSDLSTEFSKNSNSLNSHTMTNKNKITESVESPFSKKLPKTKTNTLNKGLQTRLVEQRGQQKGKHNLTKISPAQQKHCQDRDKLPGTKKTSESVRQECKEDLNQVIITSVTKTNSCIKEQIIHDSCRPHQQKSMDKIIRSLPSNKSKKPVTRVDVEELRSVQWKAPLTQWNKRPIAYEAVIKQRDPVKSIENNLQNSTTEKVLTCTSAKFEVSNNHLNDQQDKLRTEIERKKRERINMQNMVFEYKKLVDTLPPNKQLQHMIRLKQHLRPSGNTIEKTTLKSNPSEEQQQLTIPSNNSSCILLNDSPSFVHLSDENQESRIVKQIGNLLLKIKHQQEKMYRKVNICDDIKTSSPEVVVSDKVNVDISVQNDLKNWSDLWPAYEDKPNHEELMDDEQRLRRTQELIDQYYSSNTDNKLVRSLDQQKRRLGKYGRERLERELPEYQQLRTKQLMQSETSATLNHTKQKITQKRKMSQYTQKHLPERKSCLEKYKRLGRIEQLEQQKHLLGHKQPLDEQTVKNKPDQDSDLECTFIQQKRSQYCWTVGKFRVSPALGYNEQLPLREQLLRRIMKKKNMRILKIVQQSQQKPKRPKSTGIPEITTRPKIILSEDTSNINTMTKMYRGSNLWWMNIGSQRQISPLVTGSENQDDLELTLIAMMPIGNLTQVTRSQTATKLASVIHIHQKRNTIFTNKSKLKKWLSPRLLKMMTNVEERWLGQLQTKISQLDQQVELHWKTMLDKQEQQVKLLLNYDKRLQCEKEKMRLRRERRIQQLKKRTPFQALPVHHQQAHTSRAVGHMRQQQSEIPIIVIDDDEPLNDTIVDSSKRDSHPYPVFINDDLLKHELETKVLYEDQHKGISNRWKQLEVMRKEHQQKWKFKLKMLFSCKAKNRKFCRELYERLMSKIKNPNLIIALEQLNGGAFKRTEQQFRQQIRPSKPRPMQVQPRMLHRQQASSQKQAVKNHSKKSTTQHKTTMLSKNSKQIINQERSTLKQALQRRHLNKQGEQKFKKQLPQNLNYSNKDQPKKCNKNQESVNIRQLRSKRTNKLQVQKESLAKQQKQPPLGRFKNGQMLTKVKSPVMSSRHVSLLRNRILEVQSNHNIRQRKKIQQLVPKKDITFDVTENQIQEYEKRKNSTKILRTMTLSLNNQRSALQRQLDRLNENHLDTIDNQLEPSVSKTLIMSIQQPTITSLILPPLHPSTIKQQSLMSTVTLSPQRPLASIEQCSTSSVTLIPQLPIQPNQSIPSTSALSQPSQKKQLLEEKRQAMKQRLYRVHSKLKPLMEMWQLSLRMPRQWLWQQLDDIEQLRRKEFSVESMLDLRCPSGRQQTQQILQNNEVSVMASTSMTQYSLQQLQRIREYLNWRQQRLRDLIEDLLILICPEQHPMLSESTQLPSTCSVLIKLQQHPSMTDSTYSALLNLRSPSSSKQTQQQFSTYSLLLKLKQPLSVNQQSLMYSTLLKLQHPPILKQILCSPSIITTQQESITLVSKKLTHDPMIGNNEQYSHHPHDQIQEKRRLSSGNETDNCYKRLKLCTIERSPSKVINKQPVINLPSKNTVIDKNIPTIEILDSDEDVEIIDSDSSTESSNEPSFGVQVSEKSPLTIKIIKKKPLLCSSTMNKDFKNKSDMGNMNSVLKFKENKINFNLHQDMKKTKNEDLEVEKTILMEVKGKDFNKSMTTKDNDHKNLISEQEENNKDLMIDKTIQKTIVSRPTRIALLVNRQNETTADINEPTVTVSSNQMLKVAVVESTSSMIPNIGSKSIKVTPEGRNPIKITDSIQNPLHNVDRTISVISRLTEAAVGVIRKTPILDLNHQPSISCKSSSIKTPFGKSNSTMAKPMGDSQTNSNSTKNMEKSKVVTTNLRRRISALTLSKTVRRRRRLNRTISLETRGPAVPTFRDHGFAQGTIERVVHERFVTTIMTMSAAHTIASYLPPRFPRIPFDYDAMSQYNVNVFSTAKGNKNDVHNAYNNQDIKSVNTPATLSAVMGWLEKTVETSSNFSCGNKHLWNGCARTTGSTLMTLTKVVKEGISRNNAIRSRATTSSHMSAEVKTPTTIPARPSKSTRKKSIPVVTKSSKRSNSQTSTATPLKTMATCNVSIPSIKNVTESTSSSLSVGFQNRSKSAIGVANVNKQQKSQSTKRSASVAFSPESLLTSQKTTSIMVPPLGKRGSTIVAQPNKKSKSAVIDQSLTLTKPGPREEERRSIKRSASVAEYVSPSTTSNMSKLSPSAIKPPKRSKSAVVITPATMTASASSNNFIRSIPAKSSASMILSSPTAIQTNKFNSKVMTSPSSIKNLNATVPGPRVSRTLNILKTTPPSSMSATTSNDTKNSILTNSVIETSDESNTIHEKTTTITEEEQRTVTVTRTLCPTIPAPMDVTADACTLVKAACEQFIKAMVMERHLKAGRGAGTIQLHRRDAYAAAIAVDDDIRPFPDYCRTPSIGTTFVKPVISTPSQGENNVEKGSAFEQKSIVTDSRCNDKSIVIMMDKPDNNNERRAVSKQQSIIVDSKSNNKLSVLTVKTVIETQTTSSTTTTINKLQCPTSITNVYATKTRSLIEGTSARTRGVMALKKTKSSAFSPEKMIPLITEKPTTSDQLSLDPIAAKNQTMSSLPIIVPETAKPPAPVSDVTEVLTKTLPVSTPELLPEATLTFKTSTSTRGFFVERGRPLLRPAFNRRQPFGTLVATCTMAAKDTTAVNDTYFSNDCSQNLDTKAHSPNNNSSTDAWGCYFGNQQMLPPASRLNNFLNIDYKSVVPSSENQDRGDGDGDDNGDTDTAHIVPSNAPTKPPHGIVKTNGNSAQEELSLANSRQQLLFIEIARQQQFTKQLEHEMKRRVQKYQNREPDPEEVYYQKFLKLQFGSKNTPPEPPLLRPSPNSHSRYSLISW